MKQNYIKRALFFGGLTLFGLTANSQETTFSYSGSIETYTVPADVTTINIETRGAQGGNDGGLGAIMIGEFTVTPGEELYILVGNVGEDVANTRPGGGGGTFVVNSADEPLIIAGGGGGKAWDGTGDPTFPGIDASTGEDGLDGYSEHNGLGDPSYLRYGVGGTEGNGATLAGEGGTPHAGNGGGFYTSGADGSCSAGTGGLSYLLGGMGGTGCIAPSDGGFGGGGSAGNSGGGGGGGYSGGGGSFHHPTNGGGGGSFNAGTEQDNSVGNTGSGLVIITPITCSDPIVTASAESICLGGSFILTATGEGTVGWDGGVVNGEPFTPESAGVYTFTTRSDSDLDCTFSLDITVNELPEVTITADPETLCDGEELTLTGDGADDYVWDGDVVNGEPFTPELGTTNYNVVGTDEETGCENTTSISITVNALPEVTANADKESLCEGDELILTGGGADAYTWDFDVTDGEAFTPALGSTTYTVIGTDEVTGCENSASLTITVYETLTITYTTTDEIFGDDGEIDITVEGGNPPYSFDWDNDGTGDFDDTEDLAGLTNGTYIVVVQDESLCNATETINLDSQLGVDDNNTTIFSVYPNPTTNFVTISSEGPFTYQIYDINGAILMNNNGNNSARVNLQDLAKGVYFVKMSKVGSENTIRVVKN